MTAGDVADLVEAELGRRPSRRTVLRWTNPGAWGGRLERHGFRGRAIVFAAPVVRRWLRIVEQQDGWSLAEGAS